MKLVNFKAEPEDYLRWKEQARQEKLTFGEWARRRLNGPMAPALASLPAGVTKVKTTAGIRSSCDHRLPRGAWCKTCQRLKG